MVFESVVGVGTDPSVPGPTVVLEGPGVNTLVASCGGSAEDSQLDFVYPKSLKDERFCRLTCGCH